MRKQDTSGLEASPYKIWLALERHRFELRRSSYTKIFSLPHRAPCDLQLSESTDAEPGKWRPTVTARRVSGRTEAVHGSAVLVIAVTTGEREE